jgi:hypothetical protein
MLRGGSHGRLVKGAAVSASSVPLDILSETYSSASIQSSSDPLLIFAGFFTFFSLAAASDAHPAIASDEDVMRTERPFERLDSVRGRASP